MPAPAPEAGFVEDLLANPLLLPGLGGILALGAGYGWYAMRRRKKVEKFEDSLIADDGIAANSLFGSTGGQSVDTSSAFASLSKETTGEAPATEVDPIAEAEVYIAYGREAQAEEILREALRKQPERQAIRAKLLEIYSGRKDVDAFGALALEMHEMTGGMNEEWPKVVTMGLAIDPENPLYTGRQPSAEEVSGDDMSLEGNLTEPQMDALLDEDVEPADLSFAETVPMDPAELAAQADLAADANSLDFDLEIDTTIGKAGEKLASSRDDVESDLARAVDGRFDLPDLDMPSSAAPAPSDQDQTRTDDEFSLDLPALEGLSEIIAPPAEPGNAMADFENPIDLAPVELEPEPAAAPAAEPEALEDADDGMDWQEMATKLDLAAAYEEIGDKEGARELLDEVVAGGDSAQKDRARSMLAKLV